MTKLFSLVVAVCAFMSVAQAGSVRTSGEKCTRGVTYDALMNDQKFLSPQEKKDLNAGKQIAKFVEQSNGYEIGYIFSVADFDPELVMGMFSSCDQHAGSNGLGKFIVKTEYKSDGNKNPFHVFYEQDGSGPYKGSQYTFENTLSTLSTGAGRGYILNSRLINSTDRDFSPKWADAYFQVTPLGRGSFVVACNYMVPRTSWWKGTFNGQAADRLKESGRNLLKWAKRVSQDNGLVHAYRARVKTLLGE